MNSAYASRRDPLQGKVFTCASLCWMLRHQAYSRHHLAGYLRFAWLKLRRPEIVTEGIVFIGPRVRFEVRRGHGRLILGRFVHVAAGSTLRCHEGTLRIGDKVVIGERTTVDAYLDIEVGAAALLADDVHISDFNHNTADLGQPIKDQGITAKPVRVGPDVWLGTKVVVLAGTAIGQGAVLGAGAVVSRDIPAYAVAVGTPARLVKTRGPAPDTTGG